MEAEDADSEADEGDVEIVLADCGAEDDEAQRHEDCGQRAEVETEFWFADILVSARHMEYDHIRGPASEALTKDGADDEGNSETRADMAGGKVVEVRVDSRQ